MLMVAIGAGACGQAPQTIDAGPVPEGTTTTAAPSTTVAPTTTTSAAEPVVEPEPVTTTAYVAPVTTRRTTTTVAYYEPPSPQSRTVEPAGDIWWELALCESGGANVDTGNGYSGYLQFSDATWRSLGYSGRAVDHSYATQIEAGQALQARSGWGQWPACSRKLGLL